MNDLAPRCSMRALLWLTLPLVAGCPFLSADDVAAASDRDGDGFVAASLGGDDCDDGDASVHPGAEDVPYDGVDTDCDGASDYDQDGDGLDVYPFGEDCDDTRDSVGAEQVAWRPDCDGDGVPAERVVEACGVPEDLCDDGRPAAQWFVVRDEQPIDCDDADPEVHPGRNDAPYDGIDADCDGGNDYDADGDGVEVDDDCDDTRADVYPGAPDTWYDGVDSDCAGDDDYDADGDGASVGSGPDADCDDTDPDVHPGATEVWYDGVDGDCRGDDDYDADGDGVATIDLVPDCDDADASRFPGAPDVPYDGVDADCDGTNDYDQDGDGVVALAHPDRVGGTAPLVGDCDDTDGAVFPGADDPWYDGVDGNCDGANDHDQDGDGAVAVGSEAFAGGTAPSTGDCDDLNPTVHPAATEVWYDGVDGDCDGADDFDQDGDGVALDLDCDDTDPDRSPLVVETPYDGVDSDCLGDDDFDRDGDGFPWAPDAPGAPGTDCDDTRAASFPGAIETWYDGLDGDCDGSNDYDQDGDGVVAEGYASAAGGTAPDVGDCDDLDPTALPGGADVPYDGVDGDCDGANDYDQDGDGVVALGYEAFAGGTATAGRDCDDTNDAVAPGLPEVWYDGIDGNCDGANDYDRDGDGVVALGQESGAGGTAPDVGDCDDGDPAVLPGADDPAYDGVDGDCDGANDFDRDGDGYVLEGFESEVGGTALATGDCADGDPAIHPGAIDDGGVDRNCDGIVVTDDDGDGVPVESDCDDGDPAVWRGAPLEAVVHVGPGDDVASIVASTCAGSVVEVTGRVDVDAPVVVARPLTLQGSGAARLEATGPHRVLDVQADADLVGLVLAYGEADDGGCLRVDAANATWSELVLEGCTASGDGGGAYVTTGTLLDAEDVIFDTDSADRGGGLFATGLALGSRLQSVVTVSNNARLGGGLYLSDGTVALHDATLVGDLAGESGGAVYAQRMDLDVLRLDLADPEVTGEGAAALRLDQVEGVFEDVVLLGGTGPNTFSGTASLVHVTGGPGSLDLERWVLHGGVATHGVFFEDPTGLIDVHDLELAFFDGRYGVRGDAFSVDATLTIDNLWVHNVNGSSCESVHLYPVFVGTPWTLRNATISNNSCPVELAAYAWFSPMVVRNVLAGSTRNLSDASIAWLSPAGDLDIAHAHTLEGQLWRNGVNSGDPRVLPTPCPSCTIEVGSPFVAPLPSYDVRLDPADPLVGSGDPALCGVGAPASCFDPGFWGGPNPPAPR